MCQYDMEPTVAVGLHETRGRLYFNAMLQIVAVVTFRHKNCLLFQ